MAEVRQRRTDGADGSTPLQTTEEQEKVISELRQSSMSGQRLWRRVFCVVSLVLVLPFAMTLLLASTPPADLQVQPPYAAFKAPLLMGVLVCAAFGVVFSGVLASREEHWVAAAAVATAATGCMGFLVSAGVDQATEHAWIAGGPALYGLLAFLAHREVSANLEAELQQLEQFKYDLKSA